MCYHSLQYVVRYWQSFLRDELADVLEQLVMFFVKGIVEEGYKTTSSKCQTTVIR
jgi:hypothetical protein